MYLQETLYAVLLSNSRIPNFELQVYMVYGQYLVPVLIDIAGFNSVEALFSI